MHLGNPAVSALLLCVAASANAEGPRRSALHTADGVRLGLYHYAPSSVAKDQPAVVLVSDVGFNARVFDLDRQGLAPLLAESGFDTYAFDWRGTGVSETPAAFGLADLVEQDLIAAVEATGATRVVLVGWGIGGSLALAYAAHAPRRVAGVVALAAPLELDVPNVVVKRWLNHLPDRGTVRLPGVGDDGDAAAFNLLYAHGNVLAPSLVIRIRREATGSLDARLAHDLAEWMRTSDTRLFGSGVHELCKGLELPVLLLVAPLDNWMHPEFVEPWQDVLSHVDVEPLGWVDGYGEDYGHLGMLFARNAPSLVHARIVKFILTVGAAK